MPFLWLHRSIGLFRAILSSWDFLANTYSVLVFFLEGQARRILPKRPEGEVGLSAHLSCLLQIAMRKVKTTQRGDTS